MELNTTVQKRAAAHRRFWESLPPVPTITVDVFDTPHSFDKPEPGVADISVSDGGTDLPHAPRPTPREREEAQKLEDVVNSHGLADPEFGMLIRKLLRKNRVPDSDIDFDRGVTLISQDDRNFVVAVRSFDGGINVLPVSHEGVDVAAMMRPASADAGGGSN
jgi:hypothetical protein